MDTQRPIGAAEFAALAQAIWPHHWQARAAAALGVGRRSIYHYAAGVRPVPDTAAGRLEAAAREDVARLQSVVADLRRIQGLDPWGEDGGAGVDMGEPDV